MTQPRELFVEFTTSTLQELLKEPHTFHSWLTEKKVEDNVVVGIRGDAAYCPIATFLAEHGLNSKVQPDLIVTYECNDPEGENIEPSLIDTNRIGHWIEEFVQDVDDTPSAYITATTALEVLNNLAID